MSEKHETERLLAVWEKMHRACANVKASYGAPVSIRFSLHNTMPTKTTFYHVGRALILSAHKSGTEALRNRLTVKVHSSLATSECFAMRHRSDGLGWTPIKLPR